VQIVEQEILIAVASLVHCCSIKNNIIVAAQLCDVAGVQSTVDWVEQGSATIDHRLGMQSLVPKNSRKLFHKNRKYMSGDVISFMGAILF